ncbi:MAG: GTPase ObgE [Bacteroidetes bacterium]|nr:MAG: GTPase ObgE [Bacteroidota bacterium]TAG87506.1 MAG: GTPase ObgE [Bacteroidota bacterium]
MGSNFIDYVKIFGRSGAGGKGCSSFLQDKMTAKGGPNGGDGGRGGHVIVRGNSQLWTLLHLKYQRHVFAEDGEHGQPARCTGAQAKDSYIDVPLGTVMKDADTGKFIGEITEDGQEFILIRGGRGGLGNEKFKSSTNQSPQHAQPGEPRVELSVVLELKVLADVGLVGFPNAGKSTLLSVISAAKPEIADYAFTTLVPNLGVVPYRGYQSFVMADIPGIIEGAAEGRGLGIRFLRHIERNSILLFMISAESQNIQKDYDILLQELKKYNPQLLSKERLLAITKSDLLDDELIELTRAELPKNLATIFISSVAQKNIQELKDMIMALLSRDKLEKV